MTKNKSRESKATELLTRWVQSEMANHSVYGKPVHNLEKETIEYLEEVGRIVDGKYIFD